MSTIKEQIYAEVNLEARIKNEQERLEYLQDEMGESIARERQFEENLEREREHAEKLGKKGDKLFDEIQKLKEELAKVKADNKAHLEA